MTRIPFRPGLEGVVAARTALSHVDAGGGELVLAGHRLSALVGKVSSEAVLHLLWRGALPDAGTLRELRDQLDAGRALPEAALQVLLRAAEAQVAPMDAARMAVGVLAETGRGDEADALRVLAALPRIVGTYGRLVRGGAPVPPTAGLGQAATLLHALDGEIPSPARARALDAYLLTVCDHGLNASTFTARVVASTGAGMIDAVVAAIAALKGPLHGGAPGPALQMVLDIGRADRAEAELRARLTRGERLMGFGHRVYRARDPRADVLRAASERLIAEGGGDPALHALAGEVEQVALRLLAAHRPARPLKTNVEFATALLLHQLGLTPDLFPAVFAVGRTVGWTAHVLEQRRDGRLIRPSSEYVGPVPQ